jgi:hypothetical protein
MSLSLSLSLELPVDLAAGLEVHVALRTAAAGDSFVSFTFSFSVLVSGNFDVGGFRTSGLVAASLPTD